MTGKPKISTSDRQGFAYCSHGRSPMEIPCNQH